MATYVIGDVQGCYSFLQRLLEKLKFSPDEDTLWLTGDLVNRGPESVQTLNFVRGLGQKAITVLGNHDLALLALSVGAIQARSKDTFTEVLEADNADDLILWLRNLPMIVKDDSLGFVMAHAGIYPLWTIDQAIKYGEELSQTLRSEQFTDYMHHMFGQEPSTWDEALTGWDRLRFITNAFTRMRYCTIHGSLDFKSKNNPKKNTTQTIPWFMYPNPQFGDQKIIFGHWAALEGNCPKPNIFALDTGCVWGRCLTALCLETKQRFHIDCT